MALHVGDAHSWLVIPNGLAGQAQRQSRLDEVFAFRYLRQLPAHRLTLVCRLYVPGAHRRRIGADTRQTGRAGASLPLAIVQLLQDEFSNLTLVEAAPALQEARRIKTACEIELLRRASHVADVGHNTLAELVSKPGPANLPCGRRSRRGCFRPWATRCRSDKRFDLSLLLANAATQASPTGVARSSLLAGIQSHPHLEAFLGRQSGG